MLSSGHVRDKAHVIHNPRSSVITVVSIAGIICESFDVLCNSSQFNFRFAKIYLEIVDFFSIRFEHPPPSQSVGLYIHDSTALYGLILFYSLTKEELIGRRPLAKFLCIKLIVMATFYQSFVV
jgi:hypothetical protein